MIGRAIAQVIAAHTATAIAPASVDVSLLGGITKGLRYPAWYTPRVGDLVVVDWVGTSPYVACAFA